MATRRRLFNMSRNVFGGIGISVSTAHGDRASAGRQSYLVAHLTPVNQPYQVLLQQIEQALVDAGQSMAQAVQSWRPARCFGCCETQVAVLAYIDVFLITGLHGIAHDPDSAADVRCQSRKPAAGAH